MRYSDRVTSTETMTVCSVAGCGLPVYRTGLCRPHKARLERTGDVSADVPVRRRVDRPTTCTEDGCEAATDGGGGLCGRHYSARFRAGWRATRPAAQCSVDGCNAGVRSRGYCSKHYSKFRRWGTPTPPARAPRAKRTWEPNGYVLLWEPDHPNADSNGRVAEHRHVMSESLGRPLEPFENVHHINGVRDDNRLENLELWNTCQPAGQRVDDKVAWALEILRLYAPEKLASP